jgi:integrase
VEVWRACGSDDFSHIVKLLLLSGFRRQEIGDLSWTEVHLGERLIKLPGERVKNKRAHAIWLSDQSLAILMSIPASETRNLAFGRGADGYGGWGAAKAALDKRINEARARAGSEPITHWTLHDLRRCFPHAPTNWGWGRRG